MTTPIYTGKNQMHKHRELIIAWANGAEIRQRYKFGDTQGWSQWYGFDGTWRDHWDYQVKTTEVAQWRKDMAQQKEAGKTVEFMWRGIWRDSIASIEDFLNPEINLNPLLNSSGDGQEYYRIKPEHKDNIVMYLVRRSGGFWTEDYRESPSLELKQIKVVFESGTGKPISAEVL